MEIKATLKKPYSEQDRLSFIVVNNHERGYEIKETETALEAWGDTTEEISEKDKQKRIQELRSQLDAVDLKTIRSMRAIQAADFTDDDVAYLQQLEQQAKKIREEIRELQGA